MVSSNILNYLKLDDSKTVILNICTALGAFGGLPQAPKIFTDTVNKYPMLQWVLMAVLIYQGGGEQDLQLACELTLVIYFVYNVLKSYEEKSEPEAYN